ncbi:molecular chaperone [Cupriavidus metallidurans]|uniref:fimbrial biogenesis chaperone n=1 Tax=Cupriavidus TaxID=106589 RepID=UPI002580280B|nr:MULTISPECIES: molecular chaperone [unclassified Cupriavidus]
MSPIGREKPEFRGIRINKIWSDWRLLSGFRALGLVIILSAMLMQTWSPQAAAGVTPEISRVVYAADAVEQSLQVFNVNDYPVLVQAWVDDGRIDALPQESTAPIIVIPPIFRLGRGDQTSLRLINSGAALPQDRESLFWLNIYEIPSTPNSVIAERQLVTVTMRTQIKVFVRPRKLPFPSDELPKRLAFSLTKMPDEFLLEIRNPTPYYATISALKVDTGSASQVAPVEMIAPFSNTIVHLSPQKDSVSNDARIHFSLVNDDGNSVGGERTVHIGN